jgi:hypothetical protein
MSAIVQVNVTQTVAPSPDTLQSTGALISQGGTNTSPGTLTLLTQPSDLTPYLNGTKAVSTLTQVTGTATLTATTAHGYTIGDTLYVTVTGATQTAYNGTHLATVTTTTAFTYAVASGTATPATGTILYTDADVTELYSMVSTYFGQGMQTAVYVLELGPGNANDGVTFLSNWITQNPNGIAYTTSFWGFYSYLVPREWDANASFLAFLATFESPSAKTYFWVTTTLATYTSYTALMKDVLTMIEAPTTGAWAANALTALTWSGGAATATTTTAHGVAVGQWFQVTGCTPIGYNGYWQAITGTTGSTLVWTLATNPGSETVLGTLVANYYPSTGIPSTEFSFAAAFNVALSYNPSGGFVPPFGYSFLYGVTPFPTQGNGALLTTLAAASVNVVGNGAEGGISDAILLNGNTMDGNSFNYWYAIDWANITLNLNMSNAVINGSNNVLAPLYYNQSGINALQGVAASTMGSGVTAGLVLGTIVQTELAPQAFADNVAAGVYAGQCAINAVPFAVYSAANPGAYKARLYGGYSVLFTPQLGFENVIINLNATTFVG